jgi:pSer/pThr/pTyr-binding forkhead associated (FHA) protein
LVDDRGPRVDDLGSVNGILVNGIKVPAAYLKSGDIVMIGTVKIQIMLVD